MKGKKCAELQIEAYHKGYDEGVAQTKQSLKKKVEGKIIKETKEMRDPYLRRGLRGTNGKIGKLVETHELTEGEEGYNQAIQDILKLLEG